MEIFFNTFAEMKTENNISNIQYPIYWKLENEKKRRQNPNVDNVGDDNVVDDDDVKYGKNQIYWNII